MFVFTYDEPDEWVARAARGYVLWWRREDSVYVVNALELACTAIDAVYVVANLETGLCTHPHISPVHYLAAHFCSQLCAQLGHLQCLDTWSVQVDKNGNAWIPRVHAQDHRKCTRDTQVCSLPFHRTWPSTACTQEAAHKSWEILGMCCFVAVVVSYAWPYRI